MKIDLLDISTFTDINDLHEVDSPIIFQRGGIPTSTGLLSNEIFGMNVKKRIRIMKLVLMLMNSL